MAITKATASSIAPAAKGDLVAGSATNDAAVLGVGANNTVLTADSAEATGLKWATPAGGGKVLQVIYASTNSTDINTTTTFADTQLTATITPTLATSNILVIFDQNIYYNRSAVSTGMECRLLRGSTQIMSLGQPLEWLMSASTGDNGIASYVSGTYLDSPATTSATTYKTQHKPNQTANSARSIAQVSGRSSITLLEIGA